MNHQALKMEVFLTFGKLKGDTGRRDEVMEVTRDELAAALCCRLARLHAEKLTLNHALCLLVCPYMCVCVCVCTRVCVRARVYAY